MLLIYLTVAYRHWSLILSEHIHLSRSDSALLAKRNDATWSYHYRRFGLFLGRFWSSCPFNWGRDFGYLLGCCRRSVGLLRNGGFRRLGRLILRYTGGRLNLCSLCS